MDKKYYSISEASSIIGIEDHRIRYFEQIRPDLEIKKFRGRRYYTFEDIEKIKKSISSVSDYAIWKIDDLIRKISSLRE